MHTKKFNFTIIGLSFIALLAALQLMLEKIELWKNPNYIPTCSWNPLFSCQGPMESWQSAALFIPNPLLGTMGFAGLIIVAITALFAKLPKIYWKFYLAGVTFAYGYIFWLITQSLYDIQALCIYCMVVWAMVIPIFWLSVTSYVKTFGKETKVNQRFYQSRWAIIAFNYFAVMAMIYFQFADFFNFLLRG